MAGATISDALPDWIKKHIAVYLQDGEAGHPTADSRRGVAAEVVDDRMDARIKWLPV